MYFNSHEVTCSYLTLFLGMVYAQAIAEGRETPAKSGKAPIQNWAAEEDKPSEVELVSPSTIFLTE